MNSGRQETDGHFDGAGLDPNEDKTRRQIGRIQSSWKLQFKFRAMPGLTGGPGCNETPGAPQDSSEVNPLGLILVGT